MLTKTIGLCLLTFAMSRSATPQTSPDVQKIFDRLDKLEDENQKLLDEIHALRNELASARSTAPSGTQGAGAPAPASADERLDVQENRTAELDQSKVGTSQRMPISPDGNAAVQQFAKRRSSGGAQDPIAASLRRVAFTGGPPCARPFSA